MRPDRLIIRILTPKYPIFQLFASHFNVVLPAGTGLGFGPADKPTIVGWVGVEMTRTGILAAAAAVCSIILVAAAAGFRDARHESPQPAAQDTQDHFSKDDPGKNDFATRWVSRGKGDRLPLSASLPLAVANAQGEAAVPATPKQENKPEQQLEVATEDDLRQAEEEHHRHHDICARGRTWFTLNQHRYWRCKL